MIATLSLPEMILSGLLYLEDGLLVIIFQHLMMNVLLYDIRALTDNFHRASIAVFTTDFILYEQHGSIIYNCMYNVLSHCCCSIHILSYGNIFELLVLATCLPYLNRWRSEFNNNLTTEAKQNHSFNLYWQQAIRTPYCPHCFEADSSLYPDFSSTLFALFTMLATLLGDSVSSKACLGFLSIVITGFAIFSSFGLMARLNQPFFAICINTIL
jgi:hypothetical protein